MSKSTTEQMLDLMVDFETDSEKSSKAAQTRMRKTTILLEKLGKQFRKESIEAGKK